MKFRKMREIAMFVSDNCMSVSGLLALVPLILFEKIGIRSSGSGMGPAMMTWAIGFMIMLPVTGPLMLAGILIGKVFMVQPIRDELMAKRRDLPLTKLSDEAVNHS